MADATHTPEIWKDIPGYEGLYQASSLGRLRSLPRHVGSKNGSLRLWPGKILQGKANALGGYIEVKLSRGGKSRRTSAHRVVCEAFHGPAPHTGAQVAHGDGTRTNNRPDNLRWATAKENSADRNLHGTAPIGEGAGNARLTDKQILEIREEYEPRYGSLSRLARRFGVSPTQILNIVKRKQWTHL